MLAFVALLLAVLALAGCERTFQDMYDQPRHKPLAASPLWSDGRSSRPPVPGTVARSAGTLADASSGRNARVVPGPDVDPLATVRQALRPAGAIASDGASLRIEPTMATLVRGRERFDIFCAPCHSPVGDGDGMVVRRGFPRPPSFHTDAMRAQSDAHFYAVMSYGYGAMYPYDTRLVPADRMAVVAYIRALQQSQHARVADLDPAARQALEAAK